MRKRLFLFLALILPSILGCQSNPTTGEPLIDSRESDSLALIALLESNPTSSIDWDTESPLTEWTGTHVGPHDRVDVLALHQMGVTTISDAIEEMTELRYITLSKNNISEFPSALARVPKMNRLILDDNTISSLPAFDTELTNFVYFGINRNRVRTLPPSLFNQPKLQYIFAEGNELTSLPKEVTSSLIINFRCDSNYLSRDSLTKEVQIWLDSVNPGWDTRQKSVI